MSALKCVVNHSEQQISLPLLTVTVKGLTKFLLQFFFSFYFFSASQKSKEWKSRKLFLLLLRQYFQHPPFNKEVVASLFQKFFVLRMPSFEREKYR
jgi:hypothetical protein